MGIGPVPAMTRLLARAGWQVGDLGLVEVNEAFAAQAVAVIDELKLDPDLVNVNGGAIAIGHPLGCSGARITTTLLHELRRRGAAAGRRDHVHRRRPGHRHAVGGRLAMHRAGPPYPGRTARERRAGRGAARQDGKGSGWRTWPRPTRRRGSLTIPNAISVARLAGRPGVPVAGTRPAQPDRGLVGGRAADRGRAVRLAGRQDRPGAEPAEQARPGARPGRGPAATSWPR